MPNPRAKSKTQIILGLSAMTAATPPEIADAVKVSRQAVHDTLRRYGVAANTLKTFKSHRADLFAASQEKDLKIYLSLDSEERKKAIMRRGLVDMGILYDKERIERGLSDDSTRPLVVIQVRGQANIPVDNQVIDISSTSKSLITQGK